MLYRLFRTKIMREREGCNLLASVESPSNKETDAVDW